jgi:uncharacterized protein involved in response to NO
LRTNPQLHRSGRVLSAVVRLQQQGAVFSQKMTGGQTERCDYNPPVLNDLESAGTGNALVDSAAPLSPPVASTPQPGQCPRRSKRLAGTIANRPCRAISLGDFWVEPFRLFFPAAVVAGVVGVVLWPLMLAGWMEDYPGVRHARLMTQGFFGGFVFGFLGTSMPRLLEVRPLLAKEVLGLLGLYLAAVAAYTLGHIGWGDACFLAAIGGGAWAAGRRFAERKDLPPPSFALVALGFLCLISGNGIQALGRTQELAPPMELLARLLGYHGFLLLCVLGAGGFLLPRFLGIGVRRTFPSAPTPSPEWRHSALTAGGTGLIVIGSYAVESWGWPRTGGSLRALAIMGYWWHEMPLERLRWNWSGVHWMLIVGMVCLPLGIVASCFWPLLRVGMSHIELVTGFGLITVAVATRVVLGHSGRRELLNRFHLLLTFAGMLMIMGMLTRLTGDIFPVTLITHYQYGALCWIIGILLWAGCVLPGVLIPDNES